MLSIMIFTPIFSVTHSQGMDSFWLKECIVCDIRCSGGSADFNCKSMRLRQTYFKITYDYYSFVFCFLRSCFKTTLWGLSFKILFYGHYLFLFFIVSKCWSLKWLLTLSHTLTKVFCLVLSAGFWVLLQMKPVNMWQELWVKTRYSWESWIWVNTN